MNFQYLNNLFSKIAMVCLEDEHRFPYGSDPNSHSPREYLNPKGPT